MAENAAQNVVEVVRNATGEGAYRLHAAGMLQAALQPRVLFFHRLPLYRVQDRVERHSQ